MHSASSSKKLDSIIQILKTLDPSGVYSKNLEECLKTQAIEKNIYNAKFQKLLDNLDLLAKLEFKSLKKICETTDQELLVLWSRKSVNRSRTFIVYICYDI